jgi:quercetin dioxygenase-like cupin family protein
MSAMKTSRGHRKAGSLRRGCWRAPGFVVIHTLRGRITVKTMNASHDLAAGQLVMLDPEVVHDVTAAAPSDMLLTISLGAR